VLCRHQVTRTVLAALATLGLLAAAIAVAVLPAQPAAAQSANYQQVVDLTFPVHDPNRLTSYSDDYYGSRARGDHGATDIGGPNAYGVRVHAAVAGTVTSIQGLDGPPPGWGYAIRIRGVDGRDYNYLHLGRQNGPPSEAYASGIQRGSTVQRGQHIGYIGHSGNASASWPHLHLEIIDSSVTDRQGTNRINPFYSLRAAESRGDLPGTVRALPGGSDDVAPERPGGFSDVAPGHPHAAGIVAISKGKITEGCRPANYCPERTVDRGQMATFLSRALGLAAANVSSVPDVANDHPHAPGIGAVTLAGIASGKGDGRFDPAAPVRRDQMATFLAKALDLDPKPAPFADVTADNVHAGAIGAVAAEGIALGTGGNAYDPAAPVSRAQMATFLARAFDLA
jgi:hypothetical protein